MSLEQRKEINVTIIKALQNFEIPWRGECGFPRNIGTRLRYDGVNPLLLNLASQRHGWKTPYWGTHRQWTDAGCTPIPRPQHIRIGQWMQEIVLYKPPFGGTMEQELGRWVVFNLDQMTNGFDSLRVPPNKMEFSTVDTLIESTKADIHYEEGLEAAYYYGKDYIIFPPKQIFLNGFGGNPAYYHSLFHELMHWTEPRLDVDFGPDINELRAEIGADYLCTELGIPRLDVSLRANHKKRLDKWIAAMLKDPNMIFKVTANASKAVDLILSFSQEVEPRHNPPGV